MFWQKSTQLKRRPSELYKVLISFEFFEKLLELSSRIQSTFSNIAKNNWACFKNCIYKESLSMAPLCRTSQPDIGFTRSKALCQPPLIVQLALVCQWRCYRTASWALLGKRPPSLTVGKLCCSAENSAYFLLLIRLLGKRLTCHGLWSPPSFPSRSWQLYFHHKSVLPTIWNIVQKQILVELPASESLRSSQIWTWGCIHKCG